jgi:hypothetical protein
MTAPTTQDAGEVRQLWRPDRNEQMAAIEVLLASSIPTELRRALREREYELATRKDMQ